MLAYVESYGDINGSPLAETLTVAQMQTVDGYHPHINTKVPHIPFHPIHGQYQVPFVDHLKPEVERILSSSGHRIHDWDAGIAAKDYMQQAGPNAGTKKTTYTKISKLLGDIPYSRGGLIRDKFDVRLTDEPHVMLFTHHTYDVASMATGRNYSSCQDMANCDDVIGRQFYSLPQELKSKVFVAYLMKKKDVAPSDQYTDTSPALTRIAFRPATEINAPFGMTPRKTYSIGHEYGHVSGEFRDQVGPIIRQYFPLAPDVIYKHDEGSYDDGQGTYQFGKMSKAKAHKFSLVVAREYLRGDHDPTKLLDHPDPEIQDLAAHKLNGPNGAKYR